VCGYPCHGYRKSNSFNLCVNQKTCFKMEKIPIPSEISKKLKTKKAGS
jgi:hypothetical protein